MAKNWLIRTKSNHILGPVSKEKVLELYNNGSIKPDDEICSGNGYWFFLREIDLVEKYLTGDEVQNFNPISEAKDVLVADGSKRKDPTMDDITLIGKFKLENLQGAKKAPAPEVKEAPPAQEQPNATQPGPQTERTTPKKKMTSEGPSPRATAVKRNMPRQDYLKYLMVFGFLVILFLIYFRKSILNSFFSRGEITHISLMSSAFAQEEIPAKKKSSLSTK